MFADFSKESNGIQVLIEVDIVDVFESIVGEGWLRLVVILRSRGEKSLVKECELFLKRGKVRFDLIFSKQVSLC